MSASDHRPDVYGQVEGSSRTGPPPQELIDQALAVQCPDCNVNVFLDEDPVQDGVFHMKIAHDATCPWLTAHEQQHGTERGG